MYIVYNYTCLNMQGDCACAENLVCRAHGFLNFVHVYTKTLAVLSEVCRGQSACKRLLRRDEDTAVGISVRATPCKQLFR